MDNRLQEARKIINEVDQQMAKLFVKRMQAVEMVYDYKKEHNLPVLDPVREAQVIAQNTQRVENGNLRSYYTQFLKGLMAVSRSYQHRMMAMDSQPLSQGQTLRVALGDNSYDIWVQRGVLSRAGEVFDLNRRVLVVTDDGVPEAYARTLAAQCKCPTIVTIPQGEASKSLQRFGQLLQTMLDAGFSRKDCVVAVGGGVVGDLAGFAASSYMRGIDFYNIPTTLLSQIDSSIGGKTAIDLGGFKNIVGAFYQPKGVLIDPELLKTLPRRQLANGLAEAVKMAVTFDENLFALMERQPLEVHLEAIILGCLRIKADVVRQDEREAGLRKVLNFGHTIGHGIEASCNLYHGECVALGMLPVCDASIRPRVRAVLHKCGLGTTADFPWEKIARAAFHDKKADGGQVSVILAPKIGTYEIKTMACQDLIDLAKRCYEEESL